MCGFAYIPGESQGYMFVKGLRSVEVVDVGLTSAFVWIQENRVRRKL